MRGGIMAQKDEKTKEQRIKSEVSKLKKIFKEQFSESPISYFHKLKIEEIKRALCDTDNSITEISELFGFESIHYFSRFFKKHIGVSPLTYRQAFNNKEFLDE